MERLRQTAMWMAHFGLVGLVALSMLGCGSESNQTAEATKENAAEAAPQSDPQSVVNHFLEAVKSGDDETAENLLTPTARKRTEEADLYVAPPGTPTAQFTVGECEVTGNEAEVFSTWTDVDNAGQAQTDRIVWVLKKVEQGWRIYGMATTVFPGEPPLILNFEDPEDMLRKQEMLVEEIARRAEKEAEQQTAPK